MPHTIKEIDPRDALLWLPFRDQYTDAAGKRVTRNYGQAPGAPATCQMGDGVTAATFPAQIGGGKRGVVATPAQFVNTTLMTQLITGTNYKYCSGMFHLPINGAYGFGGNQVALSTWDGAGANRKGLRIAWNGGSIFFDNFDGAALGRWSKANSAQRGSFTLGFSFTSQSLSNSFLYINGVPLVLANVGGSPTNTAPVASMVLFADGWLNYGARTINSSMATSVCSGMCLFPFPYTHTQAALLHNRLMREANLP
jgi:hypothetical protein